MSRFYDLLLRSSRMQREGVWMLLQASLALVASATCFAPLHHLPAIRHSSASACTQRSFLSQDGRRNPRFVLRMQIDDVLSPQWDDPMPQWDDKPTKTQEPASEMPKGSAAEVKQKLLYACGLCDRGFSASMKERNEIGALINKLGTLSPLDAPSAGIDGPTLESDDIPLRGVWRLVYTSAIDVLNLWASPLASVGPIYQDISNPPVIVNVIDQTPRALSLLPPSKDLESVLRLKVGTRARERGPARVGLAFESIQVEPKNFFGQDMSFLPSPSIPLPKIPIFGGGDDSPAYFDIVYLDEDLLIIKQNSIPGADGGIFVSTKVNPATEPVPL